MNRDATAPESTSQPADASSASDTVRARSDAKLLELFVCPLTRTALTFDSKRQELVSHAARLAFPIRDGMPILVREEARSFDDPPGLT